LYKTVGVSEVLVKFSWILKGCFLYFNDSLIDAVVRPARQETLPICVSSVWEYWGLHGISWTSTWWV